MLAALGAACITIAPFAFSQAGESSGYGSLVTGMIVLGIGILDAALSLLGFLIALFFVGGRLFGRP